MNRSLLYLTFIVSFISCNQIAKKKAIKNSNVESDLAKPDLKVKIAITSNPQKLASQKIIQNLMMMINQTRKQDGF